MCAPPSGLLRLILKACLAQILLEKLHLHVKNLLRAPPSYKISAYATENFSPAREIPKLR